MGFFPFLKIKIFISLMNEGEPFTGKHPPAKILGVN